MFETRRILGVNVHRVTVAETLARVDEFVRSRHPHQIVTINMDFIRLAQRDHEFRSVLNQVHLAVPDGMPVLWISRWLGEPLSERVTGVDIVERGAALAAERGYSIFLLGAEPGVGDTAAAVLAQRNPGLRVAGTYAPPFASFCDEEEAQIVARIRAARPDMLFVALGAPRQDLWIKRHLHELGVPVCIGVGGALNFVAGRRARAPLWMQLRGLEWAHRLVQEPHRLWRRYLLGDLPLLLRITGCAIVSGSRRRIRRYVRCL